MTDPKTDPQENKQKKLESPEIDDDIDVDHNDEFHGVDDFIADAEEKWTSASQDKNKSFLTEEEQLAQLFDNALSGNQLALKSNQSGQTQDLALPGEPMRGPLTDALPRQWSVNVRDVMGPTGDSDKEQPHQEYFKDFGMHIAGRELNLPGTSGPTLRLGRNPLKTDLSVTDNYVSREHANITSENGKTFITNLQESNKTTLIRSGVEIPVQLYPAKTELLPGDTIRLGRYTEMQWMKAADLKNLGKPTLYKPKPGQADPAATEKAREESNKFLRTHEYSKPFPDGFQNIGGVNEIDANGKHHDKERPSVVIDQRPGADPALEQFVKDMKAKYSHLAGDPKALAEALAKESKAALEPKGWSSASVDDGYAKLRSEYAGQRMLLGDFLTAAKFSKGAGVCNHQAMLTKVAFDNFYPEGMPNRPEMKMVRGYFGESPAGLPAEMAMNHAWNTLTVPGKDGNKGRELVIDPRNRIYGEPLEAHPDHHAGKDVPQLRPRDLQPKALDLKAAPLTETEVERLRGQEVRYGTRGWKIKDIKGDLVEVSTFALKNAEADKFAEANPEAAKSGKWVVGQEYNVKRSNGEIDGGWQLTGIVERDGKNVFVLTKPDGLTRRALLEDVQKQNPEVFERVAKERVAHEHAAALPPARVVNPESHGFVPGREIYHEGNTWVVQGQNGKDIEIARAAVRYMPEAKFQELNGNVQPKVGNDYLVRRSSGDIEKWRLTGIDNNTGELILRSPTAFKEKVSLDRLAEQNQSVVGPLDVRKVLEDPRSKVNLICRWTDGESGHDKWIGEVEGPRGEHIRVMVHKPPHGDPKDWVRLRNDLAAQELAKQMGAPELFPATAYRDGMMVQAFVGEQGENVASFLHNRSRKDAELRAAEPDLAKRIEKMLDKDPALRERVAEGIAFSVLLGDHDQHGLNFVINRDGARPNDFHVARVDTDYAFSRDKTPNMDQAGNFGSVINGAFANLSEKDLPPDVRAKIKTISDQLSTQAGRDAFQRATNLSMEKVEALASRAKIMSETGKFPRTKTLAEQRAEYEGGSVRGARAQEVGDVLKVEKIGTVRAHTGDNLQDVVDRLRTERPRQEEILRRNASAPNSPSKPELRIYNDMVNSLEELKKAGKIDSGWELFPTQPESAADSTGCDVLLLNTKTGKFELMDFTRDPNKISNDPAIRRREKVAEIRKDGVIFYDGNYDSAEFKSEVKEQMRKLATREQLLQLGPPKGTPFPEMFWNKDYADKKQELDGLIDWARQEANKPGTSGDAKKLLANFADVLSESSKHAQFKLAEANGFAKDGKKFENKVRDMIKREIVDDAVATMLGRERKASTGTVRSSIKNDKDQVKLTISNDEIHTTGNMTGILKESHAQLMDPKEIAAVLDPKSGVISKTLSPREIERIADKYAKPPAGETSQQRRERVAAVLKDIETKGKQYPGARKEAIELASKAVLSQIISQRDTTEVDGSGKRNQRRLKESDRPTTIIDRVMDRLQQKSPDELLGRTKPDQSKTGPDVQPGSGPRPGSDGKPAGTDVSFKQAVRERGDELVREYLSDIGKLEKPGQEKSERVASVMDWMILLQDEKETWSAQEMQDFRRLTEAYKKGEPDAVAAVHKRISEGVDSATGGTVRAAVPDINREELSRQEQAETLKEISKAQDIAKLREFALTTTENDLARQAVRAIEKSKPENLVQIMRELSQTNTRAAGPALGVFFQHSESETETAQYVKLVQDRYKNGEFLDMMKSGKLLAEDLVGAIDRAGFNDAQKTLPDLWQNVKDNAPMKEQVAIALVKEDFLGMKSFESDACPDALRLEAMQYLGKQKSEASAKALEGVLRIREKDMAEAARQALTDRWTTEKQSTSGESASELMIGNRLKRYVDEVGAINWPDKKDISDLRERHRKAQDELFDSKWSLANAITDDTDLQDQYVEKFGDKEFMENLLKDRPAELAQYRDYMKQEAAEKVLATEYTTTLQERMKVIDSFIKDYCKEMGITAPELEFFEPGRKAENRGEYYRGTGRILINDQEVAAGLNPNSKFVEVLFHELGHLEQDNLMVRRMADELKIGKEATREQIENLRQAYKDRMAGQDLPSDTFISDVLKKRDGVPLNDAQCARADKLIDAFRLQAVESERQQDLRRYGEKMTNNARYLTEKVPLVMMLNSEDGAVKKAERMLRIDKLPAQLEEAIQAWEAASKSKAENLPELEARARDLLATECRKAGRTASAEADTLYRQRHHEVETWDIGARGRFFGKQVESGRAAVAAAIVPQGGQLAGPVRPRRGPGAPTVDRVAGTQYEQNPDGTQIRRTEVAGKPLVGDEKTWKDLLTKDEISHLQKQREVLEKLERENKLNDETRRELASLRDLEANLHDPAAHRRIIEKMGDRRPSGGFKSTELAGGRGAGHVGETFSRLSGLAILTSAVLSWCANKSHAEEQARPTHVPLRK